MYRLRHMIAPTICKKTFRCMHDRKLPEVKHTNNYKNKNEPSLHIHGIKSDMKEDSIKFDKKYSSKDNKLIKKLLNNKSF